MFVLISFLGLIAFLKDGLDDVCTLEVEFLSGYFDHFLETEDLDKFSVV